MSAQDRELRNRPWVVIFILMSLLAHLLLVVAIVVISHFVPPPKLQASNNLTTVSLSLEPPPPVPPPQTPRPKHLFMPTKADAQAPHKETLIESDQDSRLRSQSAVARDSNTIMPDVNVKQAHPANLQDSPNAPNKTPPKPAAASAAERQEKTAQQSPHPLLQPQLHPAQAQKITSQPRPEAQQVEENPSATPAPKPVAKEQLDPNGLPVLPPISAPTMAPASQRHEVAMPASSMPEVAQNVNGAVGTHGDDSPEAMATELGRYKAKVYRAVGALWYEKVEKQLQVLPVGEVHIQFTIHSDGSVDTKVLEGNSGTLQLLLAISLNSIREAAPFDPFTDSMIQDIGDSYTDDFTFSIYGNGQ